MQIHHLKHLMALAEHRTLSLSARALGISQAALSKSVRRLEAYLDVRLFERTPHGLVQTEYGRALIEQARSVLTQVAETERIIRTLRNGGAGRIAITDSVPPSRVSLALDMSRPFAAHNTVDFVLEPNDAGTRVMTKVTWAMQGRQPFMAKVMSLFINCDKMVGSQFERGLAKLKALAEGDPTRVAAE